jgi:uncharacterized protein
MKRDEALEILRRFKSERAQEYALSRIGVFGSVARDEGGEASDVDVVFETDDPDLLRASRMRQELEEVFGCHVDVIRLRERMNPRLKARIKREAHYV